uniref:Tf2-1-like SH3-like domain-containing protein n=1 Tax=Nicotiana tabacum TaxID=4097 RepID=A0A1S4CLK0_TOBAC
MGDWVFLKVLPMKDVMRFGIKGKLSPRYIGPYRVTQKIGRVAYKLELSPELDAVHMIFHVSMLRKCLSDQFHITPFEDIKVTEDLSYEEVPLAIPDCQIRRLQTKVVASIKDLAWRNLELLVQLLSYGGIDPEGSLE